MMMIILIIMIIFVEIDKRKISVFHAGKGRPRKAKINRLMKTNKRNNKIQDKNMRYIFIY
jgi:preprotein translocase subunit SecY